MSEPAHEPSNDPHDEPPPAASEPIATADRVTSDEDLLAALADDFAARVRRGERPSVEEYVAKHPQLEERIRKVLQAIALMEATRSFDSPAGEGPGSTIGRYKLLERIGEGGFGVVYMAEQHHPVRRKVALKVIKPGMDSRQILARFEAERQALAIMDHPNIARVLDAGATDSGRPYFVMELVKGEPITEFCDRNQLPPRERLELFLQVCHAVQHAHQKGIIHRDIKPSNVLVAIHDTTPVIKVIDFGVAKALGQELTEKTLFTGFAQLVGTPLYMSPEQAGQSSLDIDTRSDIYSLGVLLYELLTGTTPFDRERFKQAAHEEIRRIIREEEPPKPSTRLSQSKERLPSISAQRHTEPAKLTRLVRGELDWIVMKALEKDRGRRYETANGLARDVERYLHDEPVVACPPSASYRLQKFARRNRVAVIAALAVITGLVLLVTGLAASNRMITASRNQTAEALHQKEHALRDAEAQRQRAEAERRRAEENFLKARIAVRELLTSPALGGAEWDQLPPRLRQKFSEAAAKYYASLLQEDSRNPTLRYETAIGQRSLSHLYPVTDPRKEQLLRQSIGLLEGLHHESPDHLDYRHQLAYSHHMLATSLRAANHAADADFFAQRSIELYEGLLTNRPEVADQSNEVLVVYVRRGEWLESTGRMEEAERMFQRAIAIGEEHRAHAPIEVDGALPYYALAEMRMRAGRTRDAAELYSRGLMIFPGDHYHWCRGAILYLSIGDLEHYRGACHELINRFDGLAAERPEIAERTVKVCVLAPDSVPDFSRVERLAERSVTGTENHRYRGAFLVAKGLTDFRAGRYAQAVDRLKPIAKAQGTHIHGTAFAALAMAYYRLDHLADARASLDSARAIMARKPADAMRKPDWFDWLHCEILLREAEQMLGQ